MEEPYTIQISSNLVNKIARESGQLKKKSKKTKPKKQIVPPKHKPEPKPISSSPWPVQSPIFMPVPAQPPSAPPVTIATSELEAIRSVLQESESIMKKLEQKEANMSEELNQRARELREKEFKLPYQNAVPCEAESEACKECYKENSQSLWKCEQVVKKYEDCALKAWKLHQQVNSKA